MPNRILTILVVLLIPIAVISFNKKETNFNLSENKKISVKVKNVDNQEVINIDLEDYIIGVVAAEMPASFNIEALKAQAVAARTYAYNKILNNSRDYDLVSDITDQSYITNIEMKNKWQKDFNTYYEKIKKAVNDTKNEIITYNNKVIEAYYFAMSNGYTEDSQIVFKEEKPYLESVASKWDNDSLKNFEVNSVYQKNEFCKILEIRCNNIEINKIDRTKAQRVNYIVINNKQISGTDFRKKLNLRSTDFDITLTKNEIIIKTTGYGHGVGMSQYGANGMANEGYSYKDILKYFYKDTNISNLQNINV